MEVVSIPAVVTVVYALIEVYKMAFKSEKAKRYIPIVAGVLGAVLSLVAFYVCPAIVPTDNVFFACVFGLFSGLSAVGINQVYKQATKKGDND